LVYLGLPIKRITPDFIRVFAFFSSILGFSPLEGGGGNFLKVISAFDRARRVLSWYIFDLPWSASQANRPDFIKIFEVLSLFSSILGFPPLAGVIFESN
jgi:hypothetical protein